MERPITTRQLATDGATFHFKDVDEMITKLTATAYTWISNQIFNGKSSGRVKCDLGTLIYSYTGDSWEATNISLSYLVQEKDE